MNIKGRGGKGVHTIGVVTRIRVCDDDLVITRECAFAADLGAAAIDAWGTGPYVDVDET